MRTLLASAAALGLLIGAPALGQQGGSQQAPGTASSADQAQVDQWVCTFTGSCATDGDGAIPTKAAPGTKGFRLAGPVTTQTTAQPGAGGRPRYVATASPELRRGARTPRSMNQRTRYTAATRTVAPGAAQQTPRADLLLPFSYNSAQMTPAAEARARMFARTLQLDALKDKRFLIEGHTDLRGSRALNMDLSRRRAQAVADFLVAQGVDRSRVEVKGVGPDEPLPGRSARAEANRRVEAVLLS